MNDSAAVLRTDNPADNADVTQISGGGRSEQSHLILSRPLNSLVLTTTTGTHKSLPPIATLQMNSRYANSLCCPFSTRAFWLILFVLLPLLQGEAQFGEIHESWRWRHFSTQSGLPPDRVLNVVESDANIVWARTYRGIFEYDGYRWNMLGRSDGQPIGLANRFVADIDGGLLVATDSGLLKATSEGLRVLLPYFVSDLAPIDRKLLLVRTPDSLFVIDRETFRSVRRFPPATYGHTSRIFRTDAGSVWVSTSFGLFRWEGGTLRVKLRAEQKTSHTAALAENASGSGLAVITGSIGQRGFWEWGPGEDLRRVPAEQGVFVHSLSIAPNGSAIAVYESGLIRMRFNGQWRSLDPVPPPMQNATFVRHRPNGDFWVGTERGLFLYAGTYSHWSYRSHRDDEYRDRINEIMMARDGSTWLGTSRGVVVYRPDGREWCVDRVGNVELGIVTGIAEDQSGHIWISSGSNFDGAFRFDGKNWKHFSSREGLVANRVHKIRKGPIGSTLVPRIERYSLSRGGRTGRVRVRRRSVRSLGVKRGLISGRVYAFVEDHRGAYWFGMLGGLSRYYKGTWKHWTRQDGLRGGLIFALAEDQRGRLWFTDRSHGLGFIGEDGKPRYYTVRDGLADDAVQDIAVDSREKIWITTYAGLSAFDGEVWSTFDSQTGLTSLRLWPVLPHGDRVMVGTAGAGLAILQVPTSDTLLPRIYLERPIIEDNTALIRWVTLSSWGRIPLEHLEVRFRTDDDLWSSWDVVTSATLNNLSPGQHTFTVQAKDYFGSYDPVGYSVGFTISVPLTQRPIFYVPITALSLALIVLWINYALRKRRHESALRDSQRKLSTVVRNVPVVLFTADLTGHLTLLEGKGLEGLGLERTMPHATTLAHVLGRGPEVDAFLRETITTGYASLQIRSHEHSLDVHATVLRDLFGAAEGIIGVAADITERVRAEEIRRQSESRYQLLFNSANDAIVLIEPSSEQILEANQRACELYGLTGEQLEGRSLKSFTKDVTRGEELIQRILAGKSIDNVERVHVRTDGTEISVLMSASAIQYRGRTAILGIFRDITERRKAEDALRESEQRYRRFFEQDLTGDFVADAEGQILDCNPAFARIFGFSSISEAHTINLADIYADPQEWKHMLAVLRRGERLENYESRCHRLDGSELFTVQNIVGVYGFGGDLILLNGYVFDNTQRHLLQQQLIESQKLQSLGTLAGGIAHDFNNILNIILGYSDLLQANVQDPAKLNKSIRAINSAAQRGANLVRQILTFARKTVLTLENVDVNAVVDELARLIQETFPKTITILLDLERDLPLIEGDRTQVHQAVLNLCVNSRDAIASSGTITISTRAYSSNDLRPRYPEATFPQYVCISVDDTGSGMDESTRGLIFEPFFTTKDISRGTGLGLAVVYGIISTHKGFVDVSSTPGEGTTIFLYFPVSTGIPSATQTAAKKQMTPRGGTESILVIEDESLLQEILVSVLENAGYSVNAATNGHEALRILEDKGKRIDLVISDFGLPGLSGYDVFLKMRELNPSIPTILCSGFIRPESKEAMVQAGIKRILHKPYDTNEILVCVREVLEEQKM